MTGTPAGQAPLRASDADRERTVRVLRESAVEGRLTHDSFVRRVDLALRARDRGALDDLLVDLPRRVDTAAALRAGWARLRSRGASCTMPLLTVSRGTRLPVLTLPGPQQPVLTIGRDRTCDLVLADRTVSRLHAVLRRFGDEWFVEDLGSTNGTRVNRVRVRTATVVRAGDSLGLGGTAFRVERPRS
jgi:hypothetical protein